MTWGGRWTDTSQIADQSALTTWVIIVTLCSTIFFGLAWRYSVPEIGTAESSTFWFMCQLSAMGLMGYFVTLFPLYRRSWRVPWRWSLALGVLGALCALAAASAFLCHQSLEFYIVVHQHGFASSRDLAAVSVAMQPAVPGKKAE